MELESFRTKERRHHIARFLMGSPGTGWGMSMLTIEILGWLNYKGRHRCFGKGSQLLKLYQEEELFFLKSCALLSLLEKACLANKSMSTKPFHGPSSIYGAQASAQIVLGWWDTCWAPHHYNTVGSCCNGATWNTVSFFLRVHLSTFF